MSKFVMKNLETECLTLKSALEELEAALNAVNSSSDAAEVVDLMEYAKELVDRYNNISLLTAYSGFLADPNPVVAFAKAFTYNTVSVKTSKVKLDTLTESGKLIQVPATARAVGHGTRELVLDDFMLWAEAHSKKPVATNPAWRAKRSEVFSMVKKIVKEDLKVSNTKLKSTVQAWFDALVFVPGEKGGNQVVATSSQCKLLKNAATTLGKAPLDVSVLEPKQWAKLQMRVLHSAVLGRDFTVTYHEEDEKSEKKNDKKSKSDDKTTEDPAESK